MGAEESGFLVYFPNFVLLVDTAVDSHLSFDPLGRSAPLSTLHYVHPRSPPATYPSASLPALSTALPSLAPPAVIEDDDVNSANGDASSTASSLPSPTLTLSDLSSTLKTWQLLFSIWQQLHPNQLQSRPLILPLKVSLLPTLLLPSVRA